MKLIVLLLVVLLTGCSTVHVKTDKWEANYTRMWYEVEDFNVTGPTGEGWSASVGKVTNDVDRMESLLGGLIMKGLALGDGKQTFAEMLNANKK